MPPTFPIFWLTGNTGAGKSMLAERAQAELNAKVDGVRVVMLDGDDMRETISMDEDLSPEGRRRHNLRVARLAKILQKQGLLMLVSVIAPFARVRGEIDGICAPLWIYVKRSGLEADDKPYEPPPDAALTLDHDILKPEESCEQLQRFIAERSLQ